MATSTRWLFVVAGVTATLIVLSLVVSIAWDREADLEPGSPEWTVQEYLQAVAARDGTRVLEFYSDDLAQRCAPASVRDSLRWRADDFRASLLEVRGRGDEAEVTLSVTEVYGSGPFGRSESTLEHVFVLHRADGVWRFVEPPWPTWCPEPTPASRAPTPAATAVPAGDGE